MNMINVHDPGGSLLIIKSSWSGKIILQSAYAELFPKALRL